MDPASRRRIAEIKRLQFRLFFAGLLCVVTVIANRETFPLAAKIMMMGFVFANAVLCAYLTDRIGDVVRAGREKAASGA